jgi:hypothetical protein
MNGYFDTKSLFGTTPEELQREIFEKSQDRRQREMEFLAKQTFTPANTYGMLQTLEPLRRQFAAVGEDPRVNQLRQQSKAAQEALSRFDLETEQGKMQAASALMRMGMINQATNLLNAAKAQRSISSVGKPFDDEIKVMKDGKVFGQHIKYVDGKATVVNEWQIPADLSVAMTKILDGSQEAYTTADNLSSVASGLADEVEKNPFKGGASKTITESIKGFTGGRDLRSFLDTKFKEIRANLAVANLPPGSASDADVRLALSGVPPENASSTEVAKWLRSVASAQRKVSEYQRFKSQYISANYNTVGLTKAWEERKKEIEAQVEQTLQAPMTGTATTAPVAPQAAPQAQPQPLMPTYEEQGVVNWSDL